jgi:hypothetical protein
MECLKQNERLSDGLTKELDHAQVRLHAPEASGDAYLSPTFKANALVEEAVQAFFAQMEDRLLPLKYTGLDDLWSAFESLQSFEGSAANRPATVPCDTIQNLQKLCDDLLQTDDHDSNMSMASIALHNVLHHKPHSMQELQEAIVMLASFQKLMMRENQEDAMVMEGGGAGGVDVVKSRVQDKLRAYVVKLMNSKTDVILQCTFIVFLFVVSNGIYRYYEGGHESPSAKELMKQIVMNTVLMAALANLVGHVEVEMCVYAMYFAYIGLAVMRLVKTS